MLGLSPLNAQNATSPVKIGVLTEMSGPYADVDGPGSLVAAQMAVEDFGGSVLGMPISVISGDHQGKSDIAMGLAGRWFDVDGVDVIVDLSNSAVALAV
jgi:branched-chain amino acid transport system substrate-binding protein